MPARLPRHGLACCLLALAALVPLAARADGDALARIRERGVLVAGVKVDYPPFGMLDARGQMQGLEHDLAADLARRMGVRLQRVAVTGANRLQKLEEGSVDLVIATMGDTAERRRIATVVEPAYYASGVGLFMRPEARASQWQDIRGQTVCATQGSYFNRALAERYLLNLLMFGNARDARLAVRDGRCVGFLFDDTAIWADLQRPEWAGYKAPLPPVLSVRWAIALPRGEAGGALETLVGDAVAQWHRSGFLAEREAAWSLPPSAFLAEARATWMQRGPDGDYLCRRDAQGRWPGQCRNPVFLAPQDVGGIYRLGLQVKESTGWDLSFVYDRYDRTRFLSGLGQTVLLMAASIAGSLGLGVGAALLLESRRQRLAAVVRMLLAWGRMTPPLLLMYLLFFGLGGLAWKAWGLALPARVIAVCALSYYAGASVTTALVDACAARRAGDPGYRLVWRTLPQAYGLAAGSITATLVNVSKATMMASVIAVPELLSAATGILADRGNVGEVMNAMLLSFLLLVTLTVQALRWVERRLRTLAEEAP